MFIVIEGTDGSGKATQTELLVKKLESMGHSIEQISFPQYGERSAVFAEDYLNGKFGTAEAVGPYRGSIFYAIDRYAAGPKIRAWLEQGKTVISNRYVGSNMGHQGGKIKNIEDREKFFTWNYDLEYNIFQLPKPEINIILHVTPEISQQMVDKKATREYIGGKKRDLHEADISHLRDAEAAYLKIAETYPEFKLIECVENNNILPTEIIHEKVMGTLQVFLQN